MAGIYYDSETSQFDPNNPLRAGDIVLVDYSDFCHSRFFAKIVRVFLGHFDPNTGSALVPSPYKLRVVINVIKPNDEVDTRAEITLPVIGVFHGIDDGEPTMYIPDNQASKLGPGLIKPFPITIIKDVPIREFFNK